MKLRAVPEIRAFSGLVRPSVASSAEENPLMAFSPLFVLSLWRRPRRRRAAGVEPLPAPRVVRAVARPAGRRPPRGPTRRPRDPAPFRPGPRPTRRRRCSPGAGCAGRCGRSAAGWSCPVSRWDASEERAGAAAGTAWCRRRGDTPTVGRWATSASPVRTGRGRNPGGNRQRRARPNARPSSSSTAGAATRRSGTRSAMTSATSPTWSPGTWPAWAARRSPPTRNCPQPHGRRPARRHRRGRAGAAPAWCSSGTASGR